MHMLGSIYIRHDSAQVRPDALLWSLLRCAELCSRHEAAVTHLASFGSVQLVLNLLHIVQNGLAGCQAQARADSHHGQRGSLHQLALQLPVCCKGCCCCQLAASWIGRQAALTQQHLPANGGVKGSAGSSEKIQSCMASTCICFGVLEPHNEQHNHVTVF